MRACCHTCRARALARAARPRAAHRIRNTPRHKPNSRPCSCAPGSNSSRCTNSTYGMLGSSLSMVSSSSSVAAAATLMAWQIALEMAGPPQSLGGVVAQQREPRADLPRTKRRPTFTTIREPHADFEVRARLHDDMDSSAPSRADLSDLDATDSVASVARWRSGGSRHSLPTRVS